LALSDYRLDLIAGVIIALVIGIIIGIVVRGFLGI